MYSTGVSPKTVYFAATRFWLYTINSLKTRLWYLGVSWIIENVIGTTNSPPRIHLGILNSKKRMM